MTFHNIDPVALQIGPLALHWYGLSYVAGIVGWWAYSLWLTKRFPTIERKHIDDYLAWAVLGVVLGGRLGYVIFYKPAYFMEFPLAIPQIWHGGMSFHGGLLGVFVATLLYCRSKSIKFFDFTDLGVCGVPIGLFFGRIANFINGELYGRVTDSSWGIVFPMGGLYPRHPSQLYEAALEGLFLFLVLMFCVFRLDWAQYKGRLLGLFLVGYAITRSTAELFREPDEFLGFLWGELTMGQLLCLPLLLLGVWFMWTAKPRKA